MYTPMLPTPPTCIAYLLPIYSSYLLPIYTPYLLPIYTPYLLPIYTPYLLPIYPSYLLLLHELVHKLLQFSVTPHPPLVHPADVSRPLLTGQQQSHKKHTIKMVCSCTYNSSQIPPIVGGGGGGGGGGGVINRRQV